jgi:CBS-domain-containing membrane protein
MQPIRVEDVMTREVVTAAPDTPFKEIARLMLEHDVSGVPIAEEDGRVVGIVTEADLLASEAEDHRQPKGRSFVEWLLRPGRVREVEGIAEDLRAKDLMTTSVVAVRPETTLDEAVRVLLAEGVKRMPVTDADGRLRGIVSRGDLLRPFMREDEEIRREVVEGVLLQTMWLNPDDITVEVERGVVRLTGTVDKRSTKEILRAMTHRVSGVVGVHDDDLEFKRNDRKVGTGPSQAPLSGHLRSR